MRVLIISDEAWNDQIQCNNVVSNWFEGTEIEFANIYASPDRPYNHCCRRYFQITDSMMVKSILKGEKAGKEYEASSEDDEKLGSFQVGSIYKILKHFKGVFLRFVRECIWLLGKYDEEKLFEFIDNFNPDIIFTERYATCKILRLESIIMSYAKCPTVAFTGDDEYSLRQVSFSPLYWINRMMVRKKLRENVKHYAKYYTLSEDQKDYYESEFGIPCDILRKCGEFSDNNYEKKLNIPIRMVYAGKLYCNRWKALNDIVKTLKVINTEGVQIELHIYTNDSLNKRQRKLLNDGANSVVHGAVSPDELSEIYCNADVAIHVESSDLKNRLLTRYSFSTKIIDCMFSTCAVLAYCWKEQTGYKYLKNSGAAICASDFDELKNKISDIVKNKENIKTYQNKMRVFADENHNRTKVQSKITSDFSYIIKMIKKE